MAPLNVQATLFVVLAVHVVPLPVGAVSVRPPFSLNTGDSPKTLEKPTAVSTTLIFALLVNVVVSGIFQLIPAAPSPTATPEAMVTGYPPVPPAVSKRTSTVLMVVPFV